MDVDNFVDDDMTDSDCDDAFDEKEEDSLKEIPESPTAKKVEFASKTSTVVCVAKHIFLRSCLVQHCFPITKMFSCKHSPLYRILLVAQLLWSSSRGVLCSNFKL